LLCWYGVAGGRRSLGAQQLPPIEPPQPLPGVHADTTTTTLRVTANEVLVPTLVEKRGGGVIYGLKPRDFILEDNGVPQKIRVQEEMDTAPVALVVAVEQGGVSVLEFGKLAKLGPLLDLFLGDGKGEAALVGFDAKPHLIRDFTHSSEEVNEALKHLQPGNGRRGDSRHRQLRGRSARNPAQGVPAGSAADQRAARPRQQAHQARAVD
jgi:hypothetical protein